MYSYVATSQKSTAVQHSLLCNFIDSKDLNLVVARGNRVEVYSTKDSHLTLECELTIYGIIDSLSSYRLRQSQQDVLLVLTGRKQFCTLSYDNINKKVITLSTGSLKDKIARDLDHGSRVLIDPEYRMIAMSIYEGSLKMLSINGSGGHGSSGSSSSSSNSYQQQDAFNVRLDILRYIDIQFLYGCTRPTLCILYEDNKRFKHIKTFVIDQQDHELLAGPWSQNYVDATSHKLIAVPSPINGVLVIGEKTMAYYNGSNTPSQAVVTDSTQIMSVCAINDNHGIRFLLSDHRGYLYVLILKTVTSVTSSSSSSSSSLMGRSQQQQQAAVMSGVRSLVIDRIGYANIATSLCYLENGVLFIGSCYGDSQLIKLHAPATKSSSSSSSALDTTTMMADGNTEDDIDNNMEGGVEVLDTLSNIGPIMDMCVIAQQQQQSSSQNQNQRVSGSSGGGRGQSKLLTCSGAYKDGSLRVISSGIGIVEQASMEMPGIKGMWSMQCQPASTQSTSVTGAPQQSWDKYMVVSFLASTYVLAIENNELAEADVPGFALDQTTLHVASYILPPIHNYHNNSATMVMLQVTESSVRIVDGETLQLLCEYKVTTSLIIATHSSMTIKGVVEVVVALSDSSVLNLELQMRSRSDCQLVVTGQLQLDQTVACLSLKESTTNNASSATANSTDNMNADDSNVTTLTPALALGMWTDNTVRLLALPSFTEVCRVTLSASDSSQQLGETTQARDVLIIELDSITYLFVGLGDGTLVYFQLVYNSSNITTDGGDDGSGVWTLSHKKKVSIGLYTLSLTPFVNTSTGATCIFIACDRPTVIYSHHQKILFSAVNLRQHITHMTSFHSETFPRCLALSSENGLLIGTMDDIQKLHIQSYPLINQSPRRLAYHSTTGVIAVCTEKVTRSKVTGDIASNHVHFYEENAMQQQPQQNHPFFTFDADVLEQVISCHACALGDNDEEEVSSGGNINDKNNSHGLNDGDNSSGSSTANKQHNRRGYEYVVVGTAYLVPEEVEPSKGRILVFEIIDSSSLASSVSSNAISATAAVEASGSSSSDNSRGSNRLQVSLVAEINTKGAVFALADTHGKLVASTGHKVHILNLKFNKENQLINSNSSNSGSRSSFSGSNNSDNPRLVYECSHTGHTMSLHIKAHGCFILVGDLMRSMTLLQYKRPIRNDTNTSSTTATAAAMVTDSTNNATDTSTATAAATTVAQNGVLEEVARDFGANSMRAVEFFRNTDDVFLGTEDGGNLFTVRRQPSAVTEEERGKMEYEGFFHTGDWINVIKHGSLNDQPLINDSSGSGSGEVSGTNVSSSFLNSKEWKSTLYGTVNGGIGTILSGLSQESYQFFHLLEKAVKSVITSGTGGFSHDDYRCFSNDRRTYNQKHFIDGDLVELFLDMNNNTCKDGGGVNQQQLAIVRHFNDELLNHATAMAAATGTSASTSSASATTTAGNNKVTTNKNNYSNANVTTGVMSHLLTTTQNNPDSIFHPLSLSHYSYTVEDITRILEDVARLH